MIYSNINSIKLIENKGISVTRNPSDISRYTAISSSGTIDVYDFCNDAQFKNEINIGENYVQIKNDTIQFFLQDFTIENDTIIERFINSISGYLIEIEFLNGVRILITDSFFLEETEKDYNRNNFVLNFSHRVQSNIDYLTFE